MSSLSSPPAWLSYHLVPVTLNAQGLDSRVSIPSGSSGLFSTSLPYAKAPVLWGSQLLLITAISHTTIMSHKDSQRPWCLDHFVSCLLPGGFDINIQHSYVLKNYSIAKTNVKIPLHQRSHHNLWFQQNQFFASNTLIQPIFMKHIRKPRAVLIAGIW